MVEFFTHNAAAVLALLGVLVGAIVTGGLTFAAGWIMRKRDLDLKIWEKFLDRRIAAHETVIGLAIAMRRMVAVGGIDAAGEVARAPEVMMSKEAFDTWLVEFAEKSSPATTWLSTAVKRELHLAQDYFVTIHANLSGSAPDAFPTVGALVRQDFIDLSSKLEKAAFEFFTKEARNLCLSDLNDWHKYPREVTESRLQDTVLLSKWAEIKASLAHRD
jgi:hypothetical protein